MTNRQSTTVTPLLLAVLVVSVLASSPVSSATATTISDPAISLDNLETALRPMTIEEIEVELEGWFGLLKAKIVEVGSVNIQIRALEALEAGEQVSPSTEPPPADTSEELTERLMALATEETELISRAQTVIDELKEKGGDVQTAENYITAVSALDAARDATSFFTVLKVHLSAWAFDDDGGKLWLKRGALALLILLFFRFVSGFVGRAVVRAFDRHKRVSDLLTNFVRGTASGVVFAIGVLMALATLGIPVGPLMAALGGGGFIIGFALQETLGSFASGLLIMIYRPFDVGDYVGIAGDEGKVKEMSLVSTTLTTLDNKRLVIPNKTVWAETITNYTGNDLRRVDLVFGISYGDSIEKAMEVLRDVASSHECVLDEPELTIVVVGLGDSSVNIGCRPWVKTADYWKTYWDLTAQVKDRFDTEGISIPFPQRDVHIDSAEEPAETTGAMR